MARIAGINIPDNKHTEISLTYIFGIGKSRALDISSNPINAFSNFCCIF